MRRALDFSTDSDTRLRVCVQMSDVWASDAERDDELAKLDAESPDLVDDALRWKFTRRLILGVVRNIVPVALRRVADRPIFETVASACETTPSLMALHYAVDITRDKPRVHEITKATCASWQYALAARRAHFGHDGSSGGDPIPPNLPLAKARAARAVDRLCEAFEDEAKAAWRAFVSVAVGAYRSMGDV